LTDSYYALPSHARAPFDYLHVNSIALDDDGALIIGGRATSAAYKVDHQTAATIWQLGGKRSTFKLARGTGWVEQHDVRPRARNDTYITLFDDGGGPPQVHNSRGLKLKLDFKSMTARSVGTFAHLPGIPSGWEGNVQQLPNFNLFVGWGQQPWITEYSPRGSILFDARFVADTPSYRAYRFQWSGSPATLPAIAVSRRGRSATVYASWNGATHVKSWRVLGGSSATALHTLRTAGKSGFETAIGVPAQTYVAVQALDYGGHVMSTSRVLRSG
jgi:hypothetical protein